MIKNNLCSIDLNNFPIIKGNKLLDLGFGNGSKAIAFAKEGVTVFAADIDIGNLNLLKKRISRELVKNIKVVQLKKNYKRLPFQNNFFDRIILNEVLEHIEEPDFIISELTRILKKGGVICVSVPSQSSERIFSLINPNFLKKAGHVQIFSKKSLYAMFKKHKLKILGVKNENFEFSLFWLIASILRISPNNNGIPERSSKALQTYEKIWGVLYSLRLSNLIALAGNFLFPKSIYFYVQK